MFHFALVRVLGPPCPCLLWRVKKTKFPLELPLLKALSFQFPSEKMGRKEAVTNTASLPKPSWELKERQSHSSWVGGGRVGGGVAHPAD